jgi:hypothetical protein
MSEIWKQLFFGGGVVLLAAYMLSDRYESVANHNVGYVVIVDRYTGHAKWCAAGAGCFEMNQKLPSSPQN